MKTELIYVTPRQAREWLKQNTGNRPLRHMAVETLRAAYERGEWKVTHQGVAFATSGRLIDGQHRLTFISQLEEHCAVPMTVTTGVDESTFDVIDQGSRRTLSDIKGVSAKLAAVAMFCARIVNGNQTKALTAVSASPFIDYVTPEFERIGTFCSGTAQVWSSAAVRSAAIIQMKRGMDADFVMSAYRALNHSDIEAMPHACRALVNQHLSGKIVSVRSIDLFCRALRGFDSTQTGKISKLLLKDPTETTAKIRAFIVEDMKKGPISVGPKVAKPAANSRLKAA